MVITQNNCWLKNLHGNKQRRADEISFWGPVIKHLKAHNFVISTTNLVKTFTGLLFYAYVEEHQVRILAFDNITKDSSAFNKFLH